MIFQIVLHIPKSFYLRMTLQSIWTLKIYQICSQKSIMTLNHYPNFCEWILSLNIGKTNYVVFKQKHTAVDVHLFVKFLGVYIDEKLEWHEHIKYIINKLNSLTYAMRKIKNILSTQHLITLYYSLFYHEHVIQPLAFKSSLAVVYWTIYHPQYTTLNRN